MTVTSTRKDWGTCDSCGKDIEVNMIEVTKIATNLPHNKPQYYFTFHIECAMKLSMDITFALAQFITRHNFRTGNETRKELDAKAKLKAGLTTQ